MGLASSVLAFANRVTSTISKEVISSGAEAPGLERANCTMQDQSIDELRSNRHRLVASGACQISDQCLIGSRATKQLIANAASGAASHADRDIIGAAARPNNVPIGIAEGDGIVAGVGEG